MSVVTIRQNQAGATLSKTASGLITQSDFSSLSGWTNGGHWSATSANGTMIAYNSPITLLQRTGSGNDSATLREATPMIVNSNLWYLAYDSTNGVAPLAAALAKSTDRGRTWTRLGPQTSINSAPGLGMSGWLQDGGDGYYYLLINLPGGISGVIGTPPYQTETWRCLYADIEANNWSFVCQSTNIGTTGAFDEDTRLTSCLNTIGGTRYGFVSARTTATTGTAWTVGLSTFSTIGSVEVKDDSGASILASAINNNSGTGARPENPKVWFDASYGWIMSANGIASDASESNANDLYIVSGSSGTLPDWTAVGSYRYRIMFTGVDVSGALGYPAPLTNTSGAVIAESDGAIGFFFDGNNTDSAPHLNRDLFQGHLIPSPNCAQFTDPTPGQNTTGYRLVHSGAMTDGVIEFVIDFDSSVGVASPHNWEVDLSYRSNGASTDATATEYMLAVNGYSVSPTVTLFRANSGSFTQLAQVSTAVLNGLDSRNFQPIRCRVVVAGNVHKAYLNNALVINFTDSGGSLIASGTSYAFRADGPASVRVRNPRVYSASTISITGCGAGAKAQLRGASRVIFDSQTADGSGNVTLSSPTYPMYWIEIDGLSFPVQAFGGDAYSVVN